MPTFWSMPCKSDDREYRLGWMEAVGEHWKLRKEVRGKYRRITNWFQKHHKPLRPNPNKKRDEARWRKLGFK